MINPATWVIQVNKLDITQATAVATAVLANGGRVIEATVLPLVDRIELSTENEDIGNFVVPYGSTDMVLLAERRKWLGLFRGSMFSTVAWNEARDDMLNSDDTVMRVDEAVNYLSQYPADFPIFIRPSSGYKHFAGSRTTAAEALSWMKNTSTGKHTFQNGTMVSISPVKNIMSETRWFVVGGKVIDGSTYRVRGQRISGRITNQNDITVAQQYADKWLPNECCVMDLAETDEGIKVVEFNCFNSSGFYAHDINSVVRAMNAYMHSMFKRLQSENWDVLTK